VLPALCNSGLIGGTETSVGEVTRVIVATRERTDPYCRGKPRLDSNPCSEFLDSPALRIHIYIYYIPSYIAYDITSQIPCGSNYITLINSADECGPPREPRSGGASVTRFQMIVAGHRRLIHGSSSCIAHARMKNRRRSFRIDSATKTLALEYRAIRWRRTLLLADYLRNDNRGHLSTS